MNITAGKYKGRKIKSPNEKIVRPTLSKVRMGVFNTLFSLLGDFEDLVFLDMFGGSGIMGLEAISRGFKKSIVFEKDKSVAEIIKSNYKLLNEKLNVFVGDSAKLIKTLKEDVDVIFIDPPYMSGIYENILSLLPNSKIIVLEHVVEVNTDGFNILKQKKYGDKFITYLTKE